MIFKLLKLTIHKLYYVNLHHFFFKEEADFVELLAPLGVSAFLLVMDAELTDDTESELDLDSSLFLLDPGFENLELSPTYPETPENEVDVCELELPSFLST